MPTRAASTGAVTNYGRFDVTQSLLRIWAAATTAGASPGNAITDRLYQHYERAIGNIAATVRLLAGIRHRPRAVQPEVDGGTNQTCITQGGGQSVYFEKKVLAQAGVASASGVITAPTFTYSPRL